MRRTKTVFLGIPLTRYAAGKDRFHRLDADCVSVYSVYTPRLTEFHCRSIGLTPCKRCRPLG